jgi:histone-lysine N-methyltransferase SETMAR
MEGEEDFFSTLITRDETWCYHYDPEMKVQSKQWKRKSSPAPVKGKRTFSAGKVMATVFWDHEGIVHIEFMPKGSTINGASYANTLCNLKEAILQKRPKLRNKKIGLLHDNAPVHTSHLARAALHECKFEELFHPAYSPDLAPSDFYLFQNLKKDLKGKRYADNNAVEAAVLKYFEDQPKTFYKKGIESVKWKWEKCVSLLGDYIEKQ